MQDFQDSAAPSFIQRKFGPLWPRFRHDGITALLLVLVLFLMLTSLDAFERLYYATRRYEAYELDELFLLLLSLPGPLGWFAYRQGKEANRQAQIRLEAERALARKKKLEALGRVAGGIAHELNNQLLPVISMAEMVHNHMPPEAPDQRKMQLILIAAKRAKETVADVLDFARKQPDGHERTELSETIQTALEILQSNMPATITLESAIPPSDKLVMMSASNLHNMLANLVSNAVDAIEGRNGLITVTLSLEDTPANGDVASGAQSARAVLTVADNGTGMSRNLQEKIFDPFFTTKEVGKGVGLGLSLVNSYVERANGKVTIKSDPDAGTRVTIELPVQ